LLDAMATSEGGSAHRSEHAPFVRDDQYGVMGHAKQGLGERIRLGLASLVLFPSRLFTSVVLLLAFYSVCVVFPVSSNVNRVALSLLARAILLVIGFVNIRVHTKGKCHLWKSVDSPAAGVVSNHVGWADILILCWLFSPSFIARKATTQTPIVGRVSRAMECLYVERAQEREKASRSGAAATAKPSRKGGLAEQLQDRMKRSSGEKGGRPVVIFAEGTTTNGDFILPFKSGAFLAGVPLTLVIISYDYKRVSPAWESVSGFRHLLLMLCEPVHRASVTIMEFEPRQNESPQSAAARARQMMVDEAALTPSSATFQDKLNYHNILRQGESHSKTQ